MQISRIILAAAVMGGAAVAGAPVQAATAFAVLPMSAALVALDRQTQCGPVSPALGAAEVPALASVTNASKASAILSGQVSRLELIARQQAGPPVSAAPATAQLAGQMDSAGPAGPAAPLPGADLAPAAGPTCLQLALPRAQNFASQPGIRSVVPANTEDFLASKHLAISHTAFDGAWDRVRRRSLPRKAYVALGRSTSGLGKTALLSAVNSWTNAKVRYVEDAQQYGQMDYWADARTTLARGEGDCEDIAIAKMQILAALGVAHSDMFLTIARDTVRHADHALLVVRAHDRMWLLDNASDQVLDASQSYDYRPILSFSSGKRWIHGY